MKKGLTIHAYTFDGSLHLLPFVTLHLEFMRTMRALTLDFTWWNFTAYITIEWSVKAKKGGDR